MVTSNATSGKDVEMNYAISNAAAVASANPATATITDRPALTVADSITMEDAGVSDSHSDSWRREPRRGRSELCDSGRLIATRAPL